MEEKKRREKRKQSEERWGLDQGTSHHLSDQHQGIIVRRE